MTQQNDASGEVERAANMLRAMLLDVPDYDGEDPRARFYRSQRENLQTAINALAQPNHAGASREEIAGIVDPSAWRDKGYSWATWRIEQSLKKADEILAALSLSRPADQMGEMRGVLGLLRGWSDSEFAAAASGELCEDLKGTIEGAISRHLDLSANPPTPEQVGVDVVADIPHICDRCREDGLFHPSQTDEDRIRASERERCANVVEALDPIIMFGPPKGMSINDATRNHVAAAIRALPIESAKSAEDRG